MKFGAFGGHKRPSAGCIASCVHCQWRCLHCGHGNDKKNIRESHNDVNYRKSPRESEKRIFKRVYNTDSCIAEYKSPISVLSIQRVIIRVGGGKEEEEAKISVIYS